jgi:hypothetical protein
MRTSHLTRSAAAVAVAALLVGCGEEVGPGVKPSAPTASTVPSAPTASTAPPAPTPTREEGCSADGVPVPERPEGLPVRVARTWQRIVDAAAACDFDALARIATPRTTFSYGGGGIEVVEHGDGDLATLLRVMGLSHRQRTDDAGRLWVAWPAASTRESWETTPQPERDELAAIHSEEVIASFADYGQYLGWRVGIRGDGTWAYYVAGD